MSILNDAKNSLVEREFGSGVPDSLSSKERGSESGYGEPTVMSPSLGMFMRHGSCFDVLEAVSPSLATVLRETTMNVDNLVKRAIEKNGNEVGVDLLINAIVYWAKLRNEHQTSFSRSESPVELPQFLFPQLESPRDPDLHQFVLSLLDSPNELQHRLAHWEDMGDNNSLQPPLLRSLSQDSMTSIVDKWVQPQVMLVQSQNDSTSLASPFGSEQGQSSGVDSQVDRESPEALIPGSTSPSNRRMARKCKMVDKGKNLRSKLKARSHSNSGKLMKITSTFEAATPSSDFGARPSKSSILVEAQPAPATDRLDVEHLQYCLQKKLRPSDVSGLSRIVIPKSEAEKNLPPLSKDQRSGIMMAFEDYDTGMIVELRYSYWPNSKSRMYLFQNTGDYVRFHGLRPDDLIIVFKDAKRGNYILRPLKANRIASDPELYAPGPDAATGRVDETHLVLPTEMANDPETFPDEDNEVGTGADCIFNQEALNDSHLTSIPTIDSFVGDSLQVFAILEDVGSSFCDFDDFEGGDDSEILPSFIDCTQLSTSVSGFSQKSKSDSK